MVVTKQYYHRALIRSGEVKCFNKFDFLAKAHWSLESTIDVADPPSAALHCTDEQLNNHRSAHDCILEIMVRPHFDSGEGEALSVTTGTSAARTASDLRERTFKQNVLFIVHKVDTCPVDSYDDLVLGK